MAMTLRCPIHKRYNPAHDGEGAIKGGCKFCVVLWQVYVMGLVGKLEIK